MSWNLGTMTLGAMTQDGDCFCGAFGLEVDSTARDCMIEFRQSRVDSQDWLSSALRQGDVEGPCATSKKLFDYWIYAFAKNRWDGRSG